MKAPAETAESKPTQSAGILPQGDACRRLWRFLLPSTQWGERSFHVLDGDQGRSSAPRKARMPPSIRESPSLPCLLRVPQPQPHWRLRLDESLMGGVLGPAWGVEEWPWAPPTTRQGQPLPPSLSRPESLQMLLYVPWEGKILQSVNHSHRCIPGWMGGLMGR